MENTKDLKSILATCDICGDPTECIIEFPHGKVKKNCICSCRTKELAEIKARELQKDNDRKLQEIRRFSLMDEDFQKKTFDNFIKDEQNEKVYRIARNYCDNWDQMKEENVGLLLLGNPGIGKTYATACITNELLSQNVSVVVISTISLINRIYDTYSNNSDYGEIEILNRINSASLLVLDDLGAEHTSKSQKEKQIIYSILDARSRNRKPTICTTNLSLEDLKNKLTGYDGVTRTYDRLIELCQPIKIEGESKRLQNARDKRKNVLETLLR